MSWGSLLVGVIIGAFLAAGSAFVLAKALKFMADDSRKDIGYAVGLGSIWLSKLIAACFAVWYAQKMGVSSTYMGVGIPIGILVGVIAARKLIKT